VIWHWATCKGLRMPLQSEMLYASMSSCVDCNNCEQNRFWWFGFDFAKITILDWVFAKFSHFLWASIYPNSFVE
jgi:hypothetical protein